jgi:signal transduction histidine kinase
MSDFRVTDDAKKFQSLRRVFNCGILAINYQQIVCAFNPVAEQLTGLTASEVIGAPISVLPQPLRDALAESLSENHSFSGRDVVLQHPAGESVSLYLTTELFRSDSTGNGLIAVLAEPLAAEELESHIGQLDRLASIGTLSASMAHEIKNALVAVKTFVDLLLQENKNAELAEVVSRETKRIDSIVSQMLRFAGPAKPTFASVRVHEILHHAFKLIQHQLEGTKTTLIQDLAAVPDIVNGDGYQLEQAFVNLLFNALEAMGPNGQLTVSTDIVTLPIDPSKPHDPAMRLRVIIRDNRDRTGPFHHSPHHPGASRRDTCRKRSESRISLQHFSSLRGPARFLCDRFGVASWQHVTALYACHPERHPLRRPGRVRAA